MAPQSKSKSKKGAATLAKQIEHAMSMVEKASEALPVAAPLSSDERRKMPKLRKGGEKFIPVLTALSSQNGISVPTHPTDAMVSRIEEAQILAPLRKRVAEVLKSIDDSILRAQGESWETATLLYSVLRPIARKNANVALALAPLEEFFSHRHKSVTSKKTATKKATKVAVNAAVKAATAAVKAAAGTDSKSVAVVDAKSPAAVTGASVNGGALTNGAPVAHA